MKKNILSLICFLMAHLNSINCSMAALVKEPDLNDYSEILNIVNRYGKLIAIFIVIFALASFIYNIIVVSISGNNPQKRSEAITNVFVAGFVAACVPLSSIIVHFIFKM